MLTKCCICETSSWMNLFAIADKPKRYYPDVKSIEVIIASVCHCCADHRQDEVCEYLINRCKS